MVDHTEKTSQENKKKGIVFGFSTRFDKKLTPFTKRGHNSNKSSEKICPTLSWEKWPNDLKAVGLLVLKDKFSKRKHPWRLYQKELPRFEVETTIRRGGRVERLNGKSYWCIVDYPSDPCMAYNGIYDNFTLIIIVFRFEHQQNALKISGNCGDMTFKISYY